MMISQDLVRDLMANPSAANRERSVVELTEIFRARAARGRAATILEDIIRIFAKDAAVRVRKAVAEQLQNDPGLPNDVAMTLASDVDDVAIPILQFSKALSDTDLEAIVIREGQAKLKAIARREAIGEGLSDKLIDHGDAETVGALMENQGSAPSEKGMLKAVTRFGADDRVQAPLARRPKLPKSVMTHMVAVVSDHVLGELSARNDLPPDVAQNILKHAEESVFVDLSRETDDDQESLAASLAEMGRLTPNLAMRALIGGEITFFEHAVAHLAGLKLNEVRTLAFDAGPLGAIEICRKIGAAEKMHGVFQAGLATYAKVAGEPGGFDRERFQSRLTDDLLADFETMGALLESGDIDVLSDRLRLAS